MARTTFRPNKDVDNNGQTNGVRADRAETALRVYRGLGGYPETDTHEDALTDLLCDLRHLADREGLTFDDHLASSEHLYGGER